MKKIEMVDLFSQYVNIKSEIDGAIQSVLNSTRFIKGPEIEIFEKNLASYLNVKHVISCGNGTDALQIAVMSLDMSPGDEILIPDFTFISPAEVPVLLNMKPVFIDVGPATFLIDINKLEKAITPKTRAIIPVHLFGQCAGMDKIIEIAKRHNLYIIEDTAQALGADYFFPDGSVKKAGTIGNIGCTSFFPSKNLGCFGDGGAIFTNDDDLAGRIRAIVNHGMKTRYYYEEIGVNSRLDTVQAAILNVKFKYLDKYNATRVQAAAYYDNAFKSSKSIVIPARAKDSTHIFHQYTIVLKGVERNLLKEFLEKREIPSMIYYPVPIHLQKPYTQYVTKQSEFPVSESLCKTVLSLPMHTELDNDQLQYITSSILEFLNEK